MNEYELLIDYFAGGGGTSTGIEMATGRSPDVAVNHNKLAIELHKQNHPRTKHYIENVWDVDPIKVCEGHKVGLFWLSPDCKHFSKAKGGKPVEKNTRGLAWIAVKWAATVRPRLIILENVEEFKTWGRIGADGRPDQKHKGETFRSFVNSLKRLGYEVEYKELRACDFGAPTSRKRLILIARSDGNPIVFPTATHGSKKGLQPYRTALDIIDFTLPCKSIFDRKKPLVDATMRRIAKGIDKFILKNENPVVIQNGTQIVAPTLTKFNDKSKGQAVDVPIDTVMAGAVRFGLVKTKLIPFIQQENFDNVPQSIEKPISTLTTGNHQYLVEAMIAPFIEQTYGGNYNGTGSSISDPLPTITSVDHNRIVEATFAPFLSNYYKGNGSAQASGIDEPFKTIMSKSKMSLVRVKFNEINKCDLGNWNQVRKMLNEYANYDLSEEEIILFKINEVKYIISDISMRMLVPRELYDAQSFPKDYIIDFDVDGRPYSKKEQIARCGNAVCPLLAEAVVRANYFATDKQAEAIEEIENVLEA